MTLSALIFGLYEVSLALRTFKAHVDKPLYINPSFKLIGPSRGPVMVNGLSLFSETRLS